jgi:hypothetical protein
LRYTIAFIAPAIIISDYCSVFAVRTALQTARSSLVKAIWLATIVGITAVFVVTVIELRFSDYLFSSIHEWLESVFGVSRPPLIVRLLRELKSVAPAFFVHLWTPLFLLGAMMNTLLRMFFRGVGIAQWFLDRGDQHPLEAIGLLASLVVFAVVAVVQGIKAVT